MGGRLRVDKAEAAVTPGAATAQCCPASPGCCGKTSPSLAASGWPSSMYAWARCAPPALFAAEPCTHVGARLAIVGCEWKISGACERQTGNIHRAAPMASLGRPHEHKMAMLRMTGLSCDEARLSSPWRATKLDPDDAATTDQIRIGLPRASTSRCRSTLQSPLKSRRTRILSSCGIKTMRQNGAGPSLDRGVADNRRDCAYAGSDVGGPLARAGQISRTASHTSTANRIHKRVATARSPNSFGKCLDAISTIVAANQV